MSTYSQAYKGYIADVPRLWFKRACDSKVFYFDRLTAASVTPNTEFTEVNAGWSLHPKAYIPGQSTLEMQITSGEFNTDLFAMGSKKAPKFHYATQNSEVYEGFSPCCDVSVDSGEKLSISQVKLDYVDFEPNTTQPYSNAYSLKPKDLSDKIIAGNITKAKFEITTSSPNSKYIHLYDTQKNDYIDFSSPERAYLGDYIYTTIKNANGSVDLIFLEANKSVTLTLVDGIAYGLPSAYLPTDIKENTVIAVSGYRQGVDYTISTVNNRSTLTISKSSGAAFGDEVTVFYCSTDYTNTVIYPDSIVSGTRQVVPADCNISCEFSMSLTNGGLLPTGVIQPTAGSFYWFPVSDNSVTMVFNENDIVSDWVMQGDTIGSHTKPYGIITLVVENQGVYRAYKTEHLAAAVSSYGTNKTSVSISEVAGEEWRITVSGLKNMYSEAGEPSIDNIRTFVPSQGYFLPWSGSVDGSWTLLFNPADVAATNEVEVTYEIAVDGAIEYQFNNKEFVTGEALLRWPIYGKADDCTDAGIKGYVDLKVYKARITQVPGMDTSYKSASTWQFTLSAMNPKRSDGSVYKIAYYGADVHHDDSPEAIEGYIGYGTLRSSDGVTVGSSPITVGPNTTINVIPLTQSGNVFSTDHPGATYTLEKEDNSEWVTVSTISDPQDETISFSVTDSATYRVKALYDREGQRPADMTSTQTFTVNVAPRETNGLYRTITGSGITPSFLRGTYDAGTVKGEILKNTTVRTSSKKSFTFGAQSAADGSIDIYKKEPSASTWTKLATVDQTYTIAANKYAASGTQYVLIGHDAPMESGLLTINTY